MTDSHDATGGCQCGRIRYRLSAPDDAAYLCHCAMCRRATGGAYAAFIGVPAGAVVWHDVEPVWYRSSAIAERGFCGECGTPLAFRYLEGGGGLDITVGSLDDPAPFRPTRNVCVESRLPGWGDADRLPDERTSDNVRLAERWRAAGEALR